MNTNIACLTVRSLSLASLGRSHCATIFHFINVINSIKNLANNSLAFIHSLLTRLQFFCINSLLAMRIKQVIETPKLKANRCKIFSGRLKAKNGQKNRQFTRQRMMRKIFPVKYFECEVEDCNLKLMGPMSEQCWEMGSFIGQWKASRWQEMDLKRFLMSSSALLTLPEVRRVTRDQG